jgi:hypothetical protein
MVNSDEDHQQESDNEEHKQEMADNVSMIHDHPLLNEDSYDDEPHEPIIMESDSNFIYGETSRRLLTVGNLTLAQFLRRDGFDEDREEDEDDLETEPCFQSLSPTHARLMQLTNDALVLAIALSSVEIEDVAASGSVGDDSDHSNHSTAVPDDDHECISDPSMKEGSTSLMLMKK